MNNALAQTDRTGTNNREINMGPGGPIYEHKKIYPNQNTNNTHTHT